MKNLVSIISILILLFSCDNKKNSTHSETTSNQQSVQVSIDELLHELHENDLFMGSVNIQQEGKPVYSGAFGLSDIENQTRSTDTTRYRVGSVTKMFTAALVFKAIEEGIVHIDDTIAEYFPDLTNASKITIDHLLNHRSGIPSFTKDKRFFEYRTERKSRDQMLDIVLSFDSNFEPGSKHEYSNSNYLLLTLLLENVYHLSYQELLQKKITYPLGLKNTYSGAEIDINKNEARSYSFSDQWTEFPETHLSVALGSGSLVSTPSDLNTFLDALFNEKIITKSSLGQMTSIKDNIGRGMYPFAHNDLSGFGHGGHIDASHSISMYFPREDLAVSVTANGIDMNINGLFTYILKSYQNESFVITELHSVDIMVDELQKYVGVYSGKGPGKFSITIKNGTLYSQLNDGPNDPLVYNGNHVFTNSEVGASFIFDPTKNTLGLEQKGVADIYYFTKE